MARLRADRLLASRGYCHRSSARSFMYFHEVKLADGSRVSKPDQHVDDAGMTIDGEAIDPVALLLLMNKPLGHTCSHKEAGPLVYDLLPKRWRDRNPALSTVGRLDKETSGLLLITDDGQLLHKLTSPKKRVPKTYEAMLKNDLRGDEVGLFASGTMMLLDGGPGSDDPLLPADLKVMGPRHVRLTIYEGKYHQVRRMFEAVDNLVTKLTRIALGPLKLADYPELAPGAYMLIQPEAAFESKQRDETV